MAAGVIVLTVIIAYCNSFAAPFVYDDLVAIVGNPSIEQLWPLSKPLCPPAEGITVSGRPLLNLSLAINYAISGLDVWSYHVTNLMIHITAALLLFGILRRTFLLPALSQRFGQAATWLALAAALLWALHPLQTESVTYVAQRAESLMGLFYLLTLYCVIRGAGSARSAGVPPAQADAGETPALQIQSEKGDCPPSPFHLLWYAAAVLACLLGMATKEVMVTAPLVVLLYDRTFLAGSFGEALRRRWGLYVGLAATWGLLASFLLSTRLVLRQAEMGAPDALSYARSQPGVILHYLQLSFWPSPLCLDFTWPVAGSLAEILPGMIVVGVLLAATLWGLLRRPAWGFLGAWFFLILAPSSSVLPLRQLAFEHRMYLSLAAVVVLAVAGGYALWDRWLPRTTGEGKQFPFSPRIAPALALAVVVVALGCATFARNSDYESPLAIWQDTVNKRPNNPLAHYNLGTELDRDGRFEEGMKHYQEALRLKPNYPEAHNNLGFDLAALGRTSEAIEHYRQALQLKPDHFEAHNNLGNALAVLGKTEEAIEHCQEALRIKPDYAEAHNNLGVSLVAAGKLPEAIEHYHEALRLKSDDPGTHNNLAAALTAAGRLGEAIEQCNEALRIQPDYAEAHNNLGVCLAAAGRVPQAIAQYVEALRLKPEHADAHSNLANALASVGQVDAAVRHCYEALRIKPDYAEAHLNLANTLVTGERIDEAIEHYRQVLRLKPDHAEAHNNLGLALAAKGRTDEAIEHYQAALALKADYAAAQNNLGNALVDAGRAEEAIEHYRTALRLRPDYVEAHNNLGLALAARGMTDEAIEHYREVLRRQPNDPKAHFNLGGALARQGKTGEALEHYHQVLQQMPDSIEVLNDLAWLLATREKAEGGDPDRAIELARRAREVAGQETAHCLDTLAAAYAAAGRYDDAAITAQRAAELAESAGQMLLAGRIRARLERYRAGQPYREGPRPAEEPKPSGEPPAADEPPAPPKTPAADEPPAPPKTPAVDEPPAPPKTPAADR